MLTCIHFAWVFYCMLFFFLFVSFILVCRRKALLGFCYVTCLFMFDKNQNFYVYVSSLREHLQFNFNSNVFIDHMVWYVPCMVRFVIKRGPFCVLNVVRFVLNVVHFVLRWSVLSMVRFVPNSTQRLAITQTDHQSGGSVFYFVLLTACDTLDVKTTQ